MLAASIKAKRVALGLTQVGLAQKAQIDPQNLSKIERGAQSPSAETLRKLAPALGVSLADLLGEPESKPKRRKTA